jgi:hypothetical protein
MDMKLKQMTPREYRKLVDDICDSMIEDELELLTVASADIEVKGKKAFLVIITESDDLSDGTIKEIESKFE